MKQRTSKKEGIFSKIREAMHGRFSPHSSKDSARLKRGAELFVARYSETMKMLAKESKD